ncbi:type II toxin-antitoxin system RelE/ParE family toxin [Spirulina sp. CS-785/01]|uniref:type II toxin-antitoxin system RelE/ParE family toxin n=1 Tax=Spirulina sp. CS-785/01 TaxID=3021716 RepID=UPI00232E8B9E|nr:type II toxin-antitoxin system RelE/ParE family toxin [Spirulina sp. CS-785/01]MDB9315352.1 type II toxin-antitoxin system RelE/ParE family toxin [Spirulina sp. CS-785/01]
MNVKFLAPARQEFKEAIQYYETQRAGLGQEFSQAVQATINRIVAFPSGWSLLGNNIRRCQTHHFPYGVIYVIEEEEIIIIAVAHLHRKPDYWSNRI